jgi:hypothetical protein
LTAVDHVKGGKPIPPQELCQQQEIPPEEDQAAIRQRKYVNMCHLCVELFSNERTGAQIRAVVDERSLAAMQAPAVRVPEQHAG